VLAGPDARRRAEQSISRALAIHPGHPEALLERARLLSLDGRSVDAIRLAKQVVAADPNNASARRTLATVLAFNDQHEEALAEVETALRLDPILSVGASTTTGMVYFAAGNYEKAAKFYHDATIRSPKSQIGYDGLLVSYAMLDRLDEAKVAVKNRLRILPSTSVQFLSLYIQHTGADLRKRWLDAARKAGIPEWPFGFEGNEADRLKGAEISAVMYGHEFKGKGQQYGSFQLSHNKKGDWIYTNPYFRLTGISYIKDDLICFQSEFLVLGRIHCSPMYRNPKGNKAELSEYVRAGQFDIIWFSPVD